MCQTLPPWGRLARSHGLLGLLFFRRKRILSFNFFGTLQHRCFLGPTTGNIGSFGWFFGLIPLAVFLAVVVPRIVVRPRTVDLHVIQDYSNHVRFYLTQLFEYILQ